MSRDDRVVLILGSNLTVKVPNSLPNLVGKGTIFTVKNGLNGFIGIVVPFSPQELERTN